MTVLLENYREALAYKHKFIAALFTYKKNGEQCHVQMFTDKDMDKQTIE